jgi:chloramphenicol O-acetyltransferase type A
MRKVNLETWPRRDHFKTFSTFDYPHFNLCANVDITAFYPAVKQRGASFTVATMYLIARAANTIPEFRYRIRGEEVIEHEIVHPSTTILTDDDLFTFCSVEYSDDFSEFAARAADEIAHVKEHPSLKDEQWEDNLYFMTALPWVSFTGVMHPLKLYPADSVPRFAWGKFFEEGQSRKMPLSVQGHHALMDGLHMGRFYITIQEYFDRPEIVLGDRQV